MTANILKLKRSDVSGKIPLTTDLQSGEVAVNIYDGRLYFKKTVSGIDSIVALQSYSGGTGINVDTSTGIISTKQDISITASPTFANVTVTGTIKDSYGNAGTDGQVLQATATGMQWTTNSAVAAQSAVSYIANQGLNTTQQANARSNIGLDDSTIYFLAYMFG